MAEKELNAIEQLAENAADAVREKYGVERNEGESSVAALAWALGDEMTYEQGLVELVKAAVILDRARRMFPWIELDTLLSEWDQFEGDVGQFYDKWLDRINRQEA